MLPEIYVADTTQTTPHVGFVLLLISSVCHTTVINNRRSATERRHSQRNLTQAFTT
jgi:hypothetical protein